MFPTQMEWEYMITKNCIMIRKQKIKQSGKIKKNQILMLKLAVCVCAYFSWNIILKYTRCNKLIIYQRRENVPIEFQR